MGYSLSCSKYLFLFSILLDWRKIGVPLTENTRDKNYLTLIPSLAMAQYPSIITHNYTNFTLGFHIKNIKIKKIKKNVKHLESLTVLMEFCLKALSSSRAFNRRLDNWCHLEKFGNPIIGESY